MLERGKGDHNRCFAYEAHTACDVHGYVLETVVTPGNVHDSVAFDDVYDKVTEQFPEIETVVADSAYKTPHICKKVFDDGRVAGDCLPVLLYPVQRYRPPLSAPVIKCKKTPRKKCSFVAERREKR